MSKQNKTIEFLYEASKLLPANSIYSCIRSRMLVKCVDMNSTNSLNVKLTPRCKACGIAYKNVVPKNLIVPVKKPRCLNKLKNGTKINTKYQTLSYKKFDKYKNNKQILIAQCNLCKMSVKSRIDKPKLNLRRIRSLMSLDQTNKKKNTKRKKYDEFSGLKKSVVLSTKRKLNSEINNNQSTKKLKMDTNMINLMSPKRNKTTNNDCVTPQAASAPSITILSPNSLNKKVSTAGSSGALWLKNTPVNKSVKKIKKMKDIVSPGYIKNNSIIELSNFEAQAGASSGTSNKKRKKKNKKNKTNNIQIISMGDKTPINKNNKNIILVEEQSKADKKKKKLNNLSNFLKTSSVNRTQNNSSSLDTFLSAIF